MSDARTSATHERVRVYSSTSPCVSASAMVASRLDSEPAFQNRSWVTSWNRRSKLNRPPSAPAARTSGQPSAPQVARPVDGTAHAAASVAAMTNRRARMGDPPFTGAW